MKKFLVTCLVLLMSSNLSISAAAVGHPENTSNLNTLFNQSDGVLYLTANNMDEFAQILITTPETIDNFLNADCIIVVTGNEGSAPAVLDEQLDIPFQEVDSMNASSFVADDVDSGLDIATIYYKHNGVFAVHEINIGINDKTDREALKVATKFFYTNLLLEHITL